MQHSTTDLDRFHDYVFSGRLQQRVKEYAMGLRGTDILNDLARIKVYADSAGQEALTPPKTGPTEWHGILRKLVSDRLGDMRCLDCQGFFRSTRGLSVYVDADGDNIGNVYRSGTCSARLCVHCGSTLTVSIGGDLVPNNRG